MTSNQIGLGILAVFAAVALILHACFAKDAPTNSPVLLSYTSSTNDLIHYSENANVVLRLDAKRQLYAHGKLIGVLTTNSFTPAPPGFNEGIQLGIMAARRNPDVRDMRVLVPVALQLWEEIQRGRQ